MNRYIIIVSEDYDQYSVDIPCAIETYLTKEEIVEYLRQFYISLDIADENHYINYVAHRAHCGNINKLVTIPETNIKFSPNDLEELVNWEESCKDITVKRRFGFKVPTIYTVDEFFKEKANKRINN